MSFQEVLNKRPFIKYTFLILSCLTALFTIAVIFFEIQKEFRISMSILYAITCVISFALLIGYCALIKKKSLWLLALYIAVFVVNLGYFSLSTSTSLPEALLANRIAYLGSVLLPLSMLMMVVDLCHLKNRKRYIALFTCISIVIFLIAASGGYLDLYYKEVSLIFIDGAAKLEKVYGPLHPVYFIYLLSYSGLMVYLIIYSTFKKYSIATPQATILAVATIGNILVWLFEQIVDLHFEFLAVSYIFSEMLMLFLFYLNDLSQKKNSGLPIIFMADPKIMEMMHNLPEINELTKREKDVLKYLLLNKKRKDIADALNVTEHTVKKHTSHIFEKLNVTSRNELFEKVKEGQK